MRFPQIEVVQQWFLRVAIIAAAITAVLHEVFKSFPDWAVTPVLFLAVLTVMVQNEQLLRAGRTVTKELTESTASADSKLNDLLGQLIDNTKESHAIRRALADRTSVHVHSTYAEFYRDLRHATERATSMVRASYMRRFPPARLGNEAEAFFESCLNWARQDSSRRLRRVVCRPEGEMLAWVRAQDSISQEPNSHYLLRIVDWTVRDVDALSVAIVDEEIVFFVFSGSEDSMRGFSIKNRQVASYFVEYHNQLWNSGVTFKEFTRQEAMPDASREKAAPENSGSRG